MQQKQQQVPRIFTASEVAEYEYCPLVWWYEQYEPLAEAETEELFAHMVEMEQIHGPQAPALPEYQVAEGLLVRRGAFDEGRQQHQAHAEEVAEIEEERAAVPVASSKTRRLLIVAVTILALAVLLIVVSLLLLAR